MKNQNRPAFFLEQSSYRTRRLMDALRLLPVVGLFLWMLPIFWPLPEGQNGQSVATSTAVTYIFAIWICLIACAFALTRRLSVRLNADVPSEDDEDAS